MKLPLLIVDDDEEIRTQLKWALAKDYEVRLAEDRGGAMEAFRASRPLVTMLDLGLPPKPNEPTEGLAILDEILAADSGAKVIIVSGQGEKENAVNAVGAGAYDFLCKPVDLDELKLVLRRAVHVAGLEREFRELQQSAETGGFQGILGRSEPMNGVFTLIRKVAASSAPVLLLGDSGTGKEMAALAIHRQGGRKGGPFVPINCNAIPENLLESELFGHEKGAFTGAHADRKGLIESASGGTLFLDEIGELPPAIQVKLLRFLQEQTFHRVGGRQQIKVDTRVIAATHADLKQRTKDGSFREDLFFRLAVVVITLPPLRERGDDVILISNVFLKRYGAQNGRNGMAFAPDALRALHKYNWPGNVRELQNRVQRAVIMADSKRITATDLELESGSTGPSQLNLREARENVEREMVQLALKNNGGRITSAAADLGISRPTLYELMDKLGIQRD